MVERIDSSLKSCILGQEYLDFRVWIGISEDFIRQLYYFHNLSITSVKLINCKNVQPGFQSHTTIHEGKAPISLC